MREVQGQIARMQQEHANRARSTQVCTSGKHLRPVAPGRMRWRVLTARRGFANHSSAVMPFEKAEMQQVFDGKTVSRKHMLHVCRRSPRSIGAVGGCAGWIIHRGRPGHH
jgi:hypothetical protein